MSARMGPRVGPEHVGQRVVLRRLLGAGRHGDVLGELLSWDAEGDGTARVLSRRGEVRVPISEVLAGRPVPPAPVRCGAPHRAIGWRSLQDVAADGWRPLELDWLGVRGQGWRLRAAQGFTGRANSALTVGDPGCPLAAAVDAARSWYDDRGLTARFAVPWPLDAPPAPADPALGPTPDAAAGRARSTPVDDELRHRGYRLQTPTLVLTAALRAVAAGTRRPGARPLPAGVRLTVDPEPDEAWLAVYRYRGQVLPPVARRLLLSAPAQAFVSVRDAAGTVAVGRAASSRGWTGVSAMEVVVTHRRLGLAGATLGAIAEWGLARGDRSAYLQVSEDNAAGRALYRGAGFEPHHGYHYRVAP